MSKEKIYEKWTGSLGRKRKEVFINEKWMTRSRIVLGKKIGRSLRSDEVAHHINRDTKDDRPENLQLMTVVEHGVYHGKVDKAHLRFGPQDMENNPRWKGDDASDHAKYSREWRRRRKRGAEE